MADAAVGLTVRYPPADSMCLKGVLSADLMVLREPLFEILRTRVCRRLFLDERGYSFLVSSQGPPPRLLSAFC